jgi:hypothetical protein
MPGDYSRRIFDPAKHYRGVLMQQGRVQLDADWNAQLDIQLYRSATEALDVIGACGVPKTQGGFRIDASPDGTDLTITPGRIYVDGLLCELEAGATYFQQPYYPEAEDKYFLTSPPASPPCSPPLSPPASPPEAVTPLNLQDGKYLVFLDVWEREVNHRDDPRLREVALGGPDTTLRLQTVWQVRLLPAAEYDALTTASTGTLNAQTTAPAEPQKPCVLPPSAGYRRLENQLYRVEVHRGGSRDQATFKWSRDNATVETQIEKVSASIVTVADLGKDDILSFSAGDWVEIVDEASTLNREPYPLLQIDKPPDPATREITLNGSLAAFQGRSGLKLRRWDQSGLTASADGVAMTADWMPLEDGINVQFSDGAYHAGDYWLIPARTATGEIEWPPYEVPNPNPTPQPPLPRHHYCCLAKIEVLCGYATIADCRELFPSLTDICAEDVCFDNQQCQLPGAETVQEALDWLCASTDLRLHNKYLHGHGVVCGLKMKCGQSREEVVVERGYALDCEGYGIEVQQAMVQNLVQAAAAQGLLDETGTGKVCVSLAAGGAQAALLAVEKEVPQDFWETVLEGTLLQDFYTGCLENLLLFLGQNFPLSLTNLPDTPPVPLKQRRLTAFINLLAQLINSASGPYIFLSGSKKRSEVCGSLGDEPHSEDKLLWCFYQKLREVLASETYCAMFDQDRPFPSYKIDPGLTTIFGPALKFHQRLRLHPTLPLAYTCGAGNKIYVYNLEKRELVETLVFPASANVQVQDVVAAPDGKTLNAVALLDDKDSIFGQASIAADGTHTWQPTSIHCAAKFVRLAHGPAPGNLLYGLAINQGLFQISAIGLPAFAATLVKGCNATGLLEIPPGTPLALIAVDDTTANESPSFTKILQVNLNAPGVSLPSLTAAGDDAENDLLFFQKLVYVTGNPAPGQTKSLWRFNVDNGAAVLPAIDLHRDTYTRLAAVTLKGAELASEAVATILVTLADDNKVAVVDLKNARLLPKFRIPVQLYPRDIAVGGKGQTGYVLNWLVNTVTAIDLKTVFRVPNFTQEPPAVIRKYRQEVIYAFSDLMSHFLQYLKDCFCDKFLVDCPACGKEDKVYLGCVEIRENQIYHICNFTKRRYVKSFQTWGYWLSTIPFLPAIKTLFSKFCCSILKS